MVIIGRIGKASGGGWGFARGAVVIDLALVDEIFRNFRNPSPSPSIFFSVAVIFVGGGWMAGWLVFSISQDGSSMVKALRLVDLSELSDSELSSRTERILADLVVIKDKIEAAKVRRIETGEYADPDWYRRANTALRHKGREHQMLLKEAGRRRRSGSLPHQRAAAESNVSKDRVFIRVALNRLRREVFEEIAREAEAAFAAGGGDALGGDGVDGVLAPLPPEVLRWRKAMKRLRKSLGLNERADAVALLEAAADVCDSVAPEFDEFGS